MDGAKPGALAGDRLEDFGKDAFGRDGFGKDGFGNADFGSDGLGADRFGNDRFGTTNSSRQHGVLSLPLLVRLNFRGCNFFRPRSRKSLCAPGVFRISQASDPATFS
jgi:hypothetical protein